MQHHSTPTSTIFVQSVTICASSGEFSEILQYGTWFCSPYDSSKVTREWSESRTLELNMIAGLFILTEGYVVLGAGVVGLDMTIDTEGVETAGHVSGSNLMRRIFSH